mmetsp:Transcript_13289/g.28838  ORF Transcript_13289/g.28838 Transcript_13289/m.28838 type:complete len:142 (+) Transcript_13289:1117-1542(+)
MMQTVVNSEERYQSQIERLEEELDGERQLRGNLEKQLDTIHWLASIVMLTTTTTKVTRMESILCLSKASIFYFLSRPNISSLIPSLSITYHISVSINCAHLHPQYGIPTPAEQLAQLKDEGDEVDVDVNLFGMVRSPNCCF